MKRTPFKAKSYTWKRKPPKEKKGLFADYKSEKKGLFPKKESKTEESSRIVEELKARFVKAGILSCELQLVGCTKAANFGWSWSFAHSLKRGAISIESEQREIEIREVCYACGNCHSIIERIGNKERFDGKPKMKDIVRAVIARRRIQP